MKIFLTGGSGFVGGAAIAALAGAHEISALSRSGKSDAVIKLTGGAPVRGDLATVSADMLAGVHAVIHCAAFVEEWGPYKTYHDINVTGTERLLAAAREAGAKRFVHISTEAALFYGQPMRNIDETYPLAPQSPFPYSRTKALAELAVARANDQAIGFETIILRPRLIWGEGDKTVLPAVKRMAEAGKFVWIDGGSAMTSTTHIDNLVAAIALALQRGRSGEAYFIVDGPPVAFREFLERYLATQDLALPEKSLSGGVVRFLANTVEPLYRLAGSKAPPPITRFAAHIMSRDCTIRDEKARADLGYRPVLTLDEGLRRLSAERALQHGRPGR